jgi:release factor glutamine methyltransferase
VIRRSAVNRLRDAGVPDPERDVRRLFHWAFDGASEDAPGAQACRDVFDRAVERRAARVPVSHIVGRRAFWKHVFAVTPDVLDPRPETETLIEAALLAPFGSVLDLGTGSGCILLSLLSERPDATGLGTDISRAALAVARGNADAFGISARARFRRTDWLEGIEDRFDLIVSNPPYIAETEMAGLSPEVLHEPQIALTPGGDGLDAYRRIARDAPARLEPGGRLIVEIGPTQAGAVRGLLSEAGLGEIVLLQDLDGRDRCILAKKPRA